MKGNMENVLQIWDALGRVVPFSVRRWSWSEHSEFVVRRIVVKKFPCGDVYGDYCHDGHISQRNRNKQLVCSGCYQWVLVDPVKVVKPVGVDSGVCPICGEKMEDVEYVGHNPEILAAIASGEIRDFEADLLEDGKPVWIVKHKGGHRGDKTVG
jgi:hypothetical protein